MTDNSKLTEILESVDVVKSINQNLDYLLNLIPEIKSMIGFDHKHPHHYLDVWNHTLKVIENLNTCDLELNMAALMHDIGKPYSCQEGDVRHFRGHNGVSAVITKDVLTRLNYDNEFIQTIVYLVKYHDFIIKTDNLDNDLTIIKKRLQLQYADALAHHPDKIEKRIRILDQIKKELEDKNNKKLIIK